MVKKKIVTRQTILNHTRVKANMLYPSNSIRTSFITISWLRKKIVTRQTILNHIRVKANMLAADTFPNIISSRTSFTFCLWNCA